MLGVYSIAEVVADAITKSDRTVFLPLREYDGERFSDAQWKSLQAVARMVEHYGAKVTSSLQELADYLNNSDLKK